MKKNIIEKIYHIYTSAVASGFKPNVLLLGRKEYEELIHAYAFALKSKDASQYTSLEGKFYFKNMKVLKVDEESYLYVAEAVN